MVPNSSSGSAKRPHGVWAMMVFAREFYAETWRRNDLIRFGKFEDDWGYKNQYHPEAKTEKWRRIFPVSVGLMNSNTNWKQNYGY